MTAYSKPAFFIAAAFMLAACQKPPETLSPAANEAVVTATRVIMGEKIKEERLVVEGERRNTVKILKKSGMFQAEIPCEDAPGLLDMVKSPSAMVEREASYIEGVKQDHLQIMQAPGSKRPEIEPVLKISLSAVDGPVDEKEALPRAYREIARHRMGQREDEYRRAAALCRTLQR